MKRLIVLCSLLCSVLTGWNANAQTAQTATYDPNTGYLTIPSLALPSGVFVYGTVYSDVVIRLDSFAVISLGSSAAATPPVAATCTSANLTIAKYNTIVLGMTLDQVKQHLGCNYSATVRTDSWIFYRWTSTNSSALIGVYFDASGTTVTAQFDATVFKDGLYLEN